MKDKVKKRPSFKTARIRDNQKGALLLGLIITMVILSVLGGSMVYIFSSSTLNPISGNYAQQAYYNAEAGFRYVTALYRKTEDKTQLDPYNPTKTVYNGLPITLPNGGNAKVTLTEPTNAVSATFNAATGGLTFSTPPALADLKAPGFFSTAAAPNVVYRYRGITPITTSGTGTITGPTLTGITPSIPAPASGAITIKPTTYITSKGSFGSGFWNVSRTVNYAWALSGGGGYSGGGQNLLELPGMTAPAPLSKDSRFSVVPSVPNPNTAVLQGNVDGSNGISINLASGVQYIYVNIDWWNLGNNLNVNNAYLSQGSTLSYDMQLKQMEAKGLNNFLVGLSARVESNDMINNNFYGMSLFYSAINGSGADKNDPANFPGWLTGNAALMSLANKGKYYLVFWEMNSNTMSVIGYKEVPTATVLPPGGATDNRITDWSTIVFRIKETGTGGSKTNKISAIIYSKTQNPRGTLNWPPETLDPLNPPGPYWGNPANPFNNLDDNSIITGILSAIPNTRPEIGVHVFADWGADNKIFLDDFAVIMTGAGPGGGYVPPIQY